MQGTSRMIFPRDCVMFSIWSSKNIGSTIPFHSKVSILYGTYPRCQRTVGSLRKAFCAEPFPTWLSGTAMSPSTRVGDVSGGTNVPRKELPHTPCAMPSRMIACMLATTQQEILARMWLPFYICLPDTGRVDILCTGQDPDLSGLECPTFLLVSLSKFLRTHCMARFITFTQCNALQCN